jgi:hypothetical protein
MSVDHLRKIKREAQNIQRSPDKVIVEIERTLNSSLYQRLGGAGRTVAAFFALLTGSLEVFIQQAGIAYEAHLFRVSFGVSSNGDSTPGALNLIFNTFVITTLISFWSVHNCILAYKPNRFHRSENRRKRELNLTTSILVPTVFNA